MQEVACETNAVKVKKALFILCCHVKTGSLLKKALVICLQQIMTNWSGPKHDEEPLCRTLASVNARLAACCGSEACWTAIRCLFILEQGEEGSASALFW